MYVCICICLYMHTIRLCISRYIYVYIYMYVYMYVCMYVCMYACMYVCMYVHLSLFIYKYIYRERERAYAVPRGLIGDRVFDQQIQIHRIVLVKIMYLVPPATVCLRLHRKGLIVVGGSWDLEATYSWACIPSYSWGNLYDAS